MCRSAVKSPASNVHVPNATTAALDTLPAPARFGREMAVDEWKSTDAPAAIVTPASPSGAPPVLSSVVVNSDPSPGSTGMV